jgi:hypothetical protein
MCRFTILQERNKPPGQSFNPTKSCLAPQPGILEAMDSDASRIGSSGMSTCEPYHSRAQGCPSAAEVSRVVVSRQLFTRRVKQEDFCRLRTTLAIFFFFEQGALRPLCCKKKGKRKKTNHSDLLLSLHIPEWMECASSRGFGKSFASSSAITFLEAETRVESCRLTLQQPTDLW